MKNKIKSLFEGALSLTISALAVKILGVVYKVPLSYILKDAGMGYFNTAYTVYGLFYVLCSAGVPKAITCIISEEIAKQNRNVEYIYKFAFRMFSIIGGIISIFFLLLSPLIVLLIANKAAIYTMITIGPSILFVASGGVCRGYLTARGRLFPIAFSQIIEAVCKLALGLFFAQIGVRAGFALELVSGLAVLGITLGSFFSTLYLIICIKRLETPKNMRQKNIQSNRKALVKRILVIAAPITLSSGVLTFSGIIDMTLIMRCLTALGISAEKANEMYGNYTTLAIPMFNLILSLVSPLSVYLLPKLVQERINGNFILMRKLTEKTINYTLIFVCPCIFVFYFYSFDVLDVLFTSSQSAMGYELLAVLSIGLLFLVLLNILNTVHEAVGRFSIPILSLVIGTAVKLITEPFLILYSGFGILGVPISTVLSYFVSLMISVSSLGKKFNKLGIIRAVLLPAVSSFLCFGIPYFTIYSQGKAGQTSISLLALLLVSFSIYGIIVSTPYFARYISYRVKINKKSDKKRFI